MNYPSNNETFANLDPTNVQFFRNNGKISLTLKSNITSHPNIHFIRGEFRVNRDEWISYDYESNLPLFTVAGLHFVNEGTLYLTAVHG
jgi:hypothetical protein